MYRNRKHSYLKNGVHLSLQRKNEELKEESKKIKIALLITAETKTIFVYHTIFYQ